MRIAAPDDPDEPTFPGQLGVHRSVVYPGGEFGLLFCDTLRWTVRLHESRQRGSSCTVRQAAPGSRSWTGARPR
jgi:hypothetical protein